MARSIQERFGGQDELFRQLSDSISNNIRVAIPGIIQSFDATTQTVTVQCAIREKIRNIDLTESWVSLPILLDCPIVLPRAGNFVLTMPITAGDECIVLFSDVCIDAWFTHGGVQNQIEKRRHDLSDGICLLGAWSQPNKLVNYSTTSAQLRNEAGTAYIELKDNEINLVAGSVKKNGVEVKTV